MADDNDASQIARALRGEWTRKGDLGIGLARYEVLTTVTSAFMPGAQDDLQRTLRDFFAAGKTVLLRDESVPVRAVVFDFDGTLVEQETIDLLADRAGARDKVEALTREAMAGTLDFARALQMRLRCLSGLPVEALREVGAELRLRPGVRDFAAWARGAGVHLYCVSGGFSEVVGPIVRDLGFASFWAHDLEVANGRLTGRWLGNIVDGEAKGRVVDDLCKHGPLRRENILGIGDGANDRAFLGRVGLGIGLRPKPALHDVLGGALFAGDLNPLTALCHQG